MSTRLLHKGKAKSVKIKIKKIKKIKIKRNCWVVGCRDSPAVVSILPVVCLVVEEVVQTDIQQKCAKEKVVAKWKTFLGTSIPTLVLARVNFFLDVHFFVRVFFCVAPERPTPRTSHVRTLSPPVGVTPRTSPRTLPKQQHCRNVVFGVVFSPFSPAPGPISAFQPRFSPSSRRRLSVPPIIFTFYSIFSKIAFLPDLFFVNYIYFVKVGIFVF